MVNEEMGIARRPTGAERVVVFTARGVVVDWKFLVDIMDKQAILGGNRTTRAIGGLGATGSREQMKCRKEGAASKDLQLK